MNLHTVVLAALPIAAVLLGVLVWLLTVLLRSESDPPDTPSWNNLKQALDLQQDPESPFTLKGRWDANPLQIHYLPDKDGREPRLLLVLKANLSTLPRTNLRRTAAEGKNETFENGISIEQQEDGSFPVWNNQDVRRYVQFLLESRSRMILVREDGLGLEWILENDFLDDPPIHTLREQLDWLSHLLQQLQLLQSSKSEKRKSYPFNA